MHVPFWLKRTLPEPVLSHCLGGSFEPPLFVARWRSPQMNSSPHGLRRQARGTMSELMDWSQIPATIRGPLLGSLGADENTHYRMFAFTPPGDAEGLIRELRVSNPDRALNIGEKGAIRLLFNAVRCAAGTMGNPAPRAPPQIIVKAPASQELTATSANAVALNGTVSQVGAKVTKRISVDDEKKCHANYKRVTRGDCPPEASPNRDQISARRALVEEEDDIGVDMAV